MILPGFVSRQPIARPDLPRTEYETHPAYYALLYRNQTPSDSPTTGRPLWYFVTINNGPSIPPYRGEYLMQTRHFETIEDAQEWANSLEATN